MSGSGVRVRQISLPAAARRLSTLSHVDYEDAFVLEPGPNRDRTPVQWARAILEDAPIRFRRTAPWVWFALGLKRGSPSSDGLVLGWEIRGSTPDFVLLGAPSRLGMPAELLVMRDRHTLLFATLLQQDNPVARAVWAGVAPTHRQVVRRLIERAGA